MTALQAVLLATEHQRIVDAVRSRDPLAADRAVRRHMLPSIRDLCGPVDLTDPATAALWLPQQPGTLADDLSAEDRLAAPQKDS